MRPGLVKLGVPATLAALALLAACHGGKGPAPAATPARENADQRSRTATDSDWKGSLPTRAEELFIGRFPGVRVVAVPGGISVRIRGTTTINGDSAPLYVVDGMPYDAPNGLISINPSDIAKIEVLKDIGSTSYYGVRGANGVVLITTKRGR
jgi:TonB-dependent SusC/RagA subfamily outer membrane receptor